MKTLIKSLLILVTVSLFFANSQAQKPFSGVVEYEISYQGDLEPAMLAMLPRSITVEILGKRSKMVQQQGVVNITKINNAENSSLIVLLDLMGQKYSIRTDKEQIEEALQELPAATVTITDESKTIAGYKAIKALYTYTDETSGEEVVEVLYFTPEIGGENFNFDTPYREIPGLLLEYSSRNPNFTQTLVAKTIKKKKIRPTAFMVPADFQEVTQEELQEIFEGM